MVEWPGSAGRVRASAPSCDQKVMRTKQKGRPRAAGARSSVGVARCGEGGRCGRVVRVRVCVQRSWVVVQKNARWRVGCVGWQTGARLLPAHSAARRAGRRRRRRPLLRGVGITVVRVLHRRALGAGQLQVQLVHLRVRRRRAQGIIRGLGGLGLRFPGEGANASSGEWQRAARAGGGAGCESATASAVSSARASGIVTRWRSRSIAKHTNTASTTLRTREDRKASITHAVAPDSTASVRAEAVASAAPAPDAPLHIARLA